jgi:uncharacterized membrane protein
MSLLPVVADQLPPAAVAFGRLHPLVLHFPLGLVLAAFAVEALRALQRRRSCSPFTPVALWIGAVGAAASSMTGLAFAEEHGGGDTMFWHRWLGILSTAGLFAVAWLASRASRPGDRGEQVVPVLRGSLLASAILVGWVGHLGGNMVWGEDYALEPLLPKPAPSGPDAARADGTAAERKPAAAPAPDAASGDDRMTFYATKVLPLLTERCYECHGNGKRKGGLRMDVRASVAGKDEDGRWIAQPGDPAHSLLIERCLLPAEDDEAMPPEGDRLKASELDILRRWIEDGVVMPEAAAPVAPQAAAPPPQARRSRVADQLPALTAAEITEAAALRARGINAVPVAQGASTFVVSMPGGRDAGDANLSALFPIAGKVEELSLARSAVTDDAMMRVPPMPAVRSVRLDNTQLSDVGIAALLSRTTDAEVVNLVGTRATDAVFAALLQLPSLRRAYVFDTAVTGAGIEAFRARRPGVEIVVEQATAGVGNVDGPPVTGP